MTGESIYLWIDDERPMPPNYTHHVKTSAEAIEFLQSIDPEDLMLISFDHDLGFDPTDGHPKLEGENPSYDDAKPIVRWMVKNDVFPMLVKVHSMNPVGAEWIYHAFKEERFSLPVVRQPYNPRNPQ